MKTAEVVEGQPRSWSVVLFDTSCVAYMFRSFIIQIEAHHRLHSYVPVNNAIKLVM